MTKLTTRIVASEFVTIPWLQEGLKHVGQKEIKGVKTNLRIQSWLKNLKAWWTDDETPWCGTFVAHCIQSSGVRPAKAWFRALDWLNWGTAIARPALGCVVVFSRKGGGHVGIVAGKDSRGRLMVLGGNQNDMVSIAPFELMRVVGYRWPAIPTTFNMVYDLPIISSNAASSTNEA